MYVSEKIDELEGLGLSISPISVAPLRTFTTQTVPTRSISTITRLPIPSTIRSLPTNLPIRATSPTPVAPPAEKERIEDAQEVAASRPAWVLPVAIAGAVAIAVVLLSRKK